MKPIIMVLGVFLLTTSAVSAQPLPSAPYTGTAAGRSGEVVLWSQLDDPSGSAFADQAFEASYAAYDSWAADDFVVPGVGGWHPWDLFTPGSVSVTGTSPLFVSLAFYEDAGGVPGAVLDGCDFPANTNFTSDDGDLTIEIQDCYVTAGPTWFSQQVRQDFNPFGQHYWATRIAARENPAVWKNPGNGLGNGCIDWQPANAACGMTGEDFLFELLGLGKPNVDGVPTIGPFGAVVMVLALSGGSAYVLRRRR